MNPRSAGKSCAPETLRAPHQLPKAAHTQVWRLVEETGSRRERDDDYRHVIVQLNDRWRVIDCKDGIQWILQRRDANTSHRGFWRGWRFHVTREWLIASCVSLAGLDSGQALDLLAFLPEQYVRKTHDE